MKILRKVVVYDIEQEIDPGQWSLVAMRVSEERIKGLISLLRQKRQSVKIRAIRHVTYSREVYF